MFYRHLRLCYPCFPSEQEFTHSVLSSDDIQSHTQDGDLYLLHQFTLEWPRLQAGGLLLPDLVEFYQWLHTALGEPTYVLLVSQVNSFCIPVYCVHVRNNLLTQIYVVLKSISSHILAYLVTKERATTLPIGHVVKLAVQRYNKDEGEHLQTLYSRVKGEWFG